MKDETREEFLERLDREMAAFKEPEPITDTQGRVWTWWKGSLYRNGSSALPRALINSK